MYNGYSDVGGYNMSYDTDTISSFPIEMPGAVMTEQADFWAMFGSARTVRLDDASQSRMLLETGAADPYPIGGKSGDQEDNQPSQEPEPSQEPSAEGLTVSSDDAATTMTFNPDGTYVFSFESYGVEDKGTYTYEGGKLTLVNANGTEAVAEGDPLKMHYVTSVSDQLTGDFTIAATDLSGSGVMEPANPGAEDVVVTSDDGATTMTFKPDGTYVFTFESYGVEDKGTYTYESGKLTLVNANGAEAVAEGNPLKLHYVTSVSDQLTGDFTIDAVALAA